MKGSKEKLVISAYDFANSDWFLRRSPNKEPFFVKIDKQMYQNIKCTMPAEEFFKLHKEYNNLLNKDPKK